jgi:hypothetical protein
VQNVAVVSSLVYLPFAQMNRQTLFIYPLLIGALACGRGQILSGEARSDAFACVGDACTNVIDPVLNDIFPCRLLPLSEAEPKEMCRRLFVDIMGKTPSDADFAARCDGKSLDAILEDLMGSEDYVLQRQKLWAARFGYNDARSWYQNTIQLDTLVGSLYRGEIGIVEFVTKAAVHPGLLSSADGTLTAYVERSANPRIDPRALAAGPSGDGFVERVFEALLFRSPTSDEMAEFPNLYRQFEIDPAGPDATLPGFTARRVRIQPCNCTGAKRVFCQTQGIAVRDVSLPLRRPSAANCAAEPFNAFYFEEATNEEIAILRAPGELLPQREDFYRNYAKEALDRLLGYDVVAALDAATASKLLAALADNVKQDGSLRNLEANIFRSVLYRQAQNPTSAPVDCDGKESPLFAGPRKTMDSETFLASASNVTAYDFGRCDFRLQVRAYAKQAGGTGYAPTHLVYRFKAKDEATDEPDFSSRDKTRTVDACTDHVAANTSDDAGPFTLMGYDALAREACGQGTSVVPSGFNGSDTSDATLGSVVDYQFSRFFLDTPTADEKSASVSAMKSCLASTQTCPAAAVGQRLCAALLKSSRFLTY